MNRLGKILTLGLAKKTVTSPLGDWMLAHSGAYAKLWESGLPFISRPAPELSVA